MNIHVELLAIGAGPSNLALAVAIEELDQDGLAADSLLLEQHESVTWQRGMLIPWTQSQVSFLKDLVTLRNPRSKFSFVNYLHDVGRLDDFINLGAFTPYRAEISSYLRWVAQTLTKVRVSFGCRCEHIEPTRDAAGNVSGWLVRLADNSTITCRYLVLGGGRDAHVPAVFNGLPHERLIHSTDFSDRVAELDPARPHRVIVIGGAQSAAEMLWTVHQQLPLARCTMVMRSIGLSAYQSSKFTNELYNTSFIDTFFAALPDARRQLLAEMHNTNYSGLNPSLLDSLYRQLYLDRLTGTGRMRFVTMADVTEAHVADGEVVLAITDRRTGLSEDLRGDVVMLGTGFEVGMPLAIRKLAAALGLEQVTVNRAYRLILPSTAVGACYLQGVNEATHGIADSLLSVLAARAGDIATDIIADRAAAHIADTRHVT